LTKWYLDCVSEAGEVSIAYWARFTWKRVSVSYSAILFEGTTHEHLFSSDPPQIDGDILTWTNESLQCSATLRRRSPRYAAPLLASRDGIVEWRCEMPAADADIRIAGRDLRGRGYAEVLELTIPPWRLPIDELRWGRYGGDGVSLVWIEWRGSHPLSVILLNGESVVGSVRDDSVIAEDLTLSIDRGSVIREARVGESLRSIVALRSLLPKRLLRARETKWCARGTIRRGDTIIDRGWAVHEVVKFS
jgi:hypothetical protein